MKIEGSGRVESSGVRRVSKSSTSSSFSVSETSEQERAVTVAGPGPIASVESILTLQGLDDSTSGRSKSISHGEQLLEMLDQVRDGLLAGGIPRSTLNRLANAVSRRQDGFADPKLQTVLDEIDLRARVELAKLEASDRLPG
ncbi:MAG TPA: flagellar assembly protein FliX [Xanthobacteraceae bacterium]|nr:flagellar assembly protein FliX [Xanthobacteraceae bacterium]